VSSSGRPRRWADALAVASYLALGLWVTAGLWVDPARQMPLANRDDHSFFLLMMAHGERVVFHGAAPLFFDRLNVPAGVNIMANTSMLAASLPLAPLTHLLGPGVTVDLLITLGLAGTATAWYWVLSRHWVASRGAARVGGLWGGFAPGWMSHANGQVNFVSGYLIPFIVLQTLRLREPGRTWRGGVTLGLLVVLQMFINEELLLIAALALGAMVVAYAVMNHREARAVAPRFLAGGAVAAVLAGVLLAYPLYFQFRGPGHYHGQPFRLDRYATSLGALVAYPPESIAGQNRLTPRFNANLTEDTTFWGPVGVLMIVVAVVMVWRSVAARAAVIAGALLLALSFGAHIRLTRVPGGPPSPLGVVNNLPLFDLVTVPRYALVPTAIAGVLLALATDRAVRLNAWPRALFVAGLVLAFVPLFPRPLPTQQAPPVPAFFAAGMWRGYVPGGRSVVTVPLPDRVSGREADRLAALSNLAFPIPRGYFMGPKNPPSDDTGSWSAPPRYTSTLLAKVASTGVVPPPSAGQRQRILGDLSYWRAGVVVLLPDARHHSALHKVLANALGAPSSIGGVELWDMRALPPYGLPTPG
jgi:hypothetical protein